MPMPASCRRRSPPAAPIDEDARARRLEQDGVALADVEERHAQAGRLRPGRRRARPAPARGEEHERRYREATSRREAESEVRGAGGRAACPATPPRRRARRAAPYGRRSRAPGSDATTARDELEPGRGPAREPGERRRGAGRDGIGRPPRAARARARPAPREARARSRAPCRRAPVRSGRARPAPSRDRRRVATAIASAASRGTG